nr:hypothetical protein [Tanacetum cinerariifolium]
MEPSFKDLDSPEDDPVITVDDSDEDNEDVYTPPNVKTEDTLSQMHKLEAEKNKAEAEAALLKAQPSFPNVEQLNELLVKSVKSEFSKILSTHNFSSSLPTKLKDLPSKFNDLTEKKVKKFDFVTKDGKHIHLTEEQINQQKKIEEEAKAEAAKHKSEVRKKELIDLLGLEDPLDKLNDLINKKRKHADDIHDYFKANKRLKSLVQYKDHLLGTVLNKPVLGLGLDDHVRTFSTLLLVKVDKRNLNPLKQMRTIEQLRQ